MTAKHVKAKALYYYRISLQYPMVATEVDGLDVCVANLKNIVGFEVKVSRSDLMRDIRILKDAQANVSRQKHEDWCKEQFYSSLLRPDAYRCKRIPNLFYFAVTEHLAPLAVESVAGTPMGVVEFPKYGKVTYHRKAQKIHNEWPDILDGKLLARMGSEIMRLRKDLAK